MVDQLHAAFTHPGELAQGFNAQINDSGLAQLSAGIAEVWQHYATYTDFMEATAQSDIESSITSFLATSEKGVTIDVQ